ncbi:hypothetical protein LCGC14_0326220 [marine sediment metagenome]|uniref:Uncharacterized protein n=1 Tax=marine sediment metagenome TaxID=412755 RepID=A0A0F9W587_9ZZZZ
MKAKRIVCLIVAGEHEIFGVIDGKTVEQRLRQTLEAVEHTPAGIKMVIDVLVGNEEVPVPFRQEEDPE